MKLALLELSALQLWEEYTGQKGAEPLDSLRELLSPDVLEQLAAWGGANATLAAKAAQALKEHVAEASGSLCS